MIIYNKEQQLATIHPNTHPIATSLQRSSPIIAGGESQLRGRVNNPFLKMIPSLLVLIACVTGIVYSVLGGSSYLLLAFAPGTLGSVYIIVKECCTQDLRTFSENNESFRNSIGVLRGRIHELETEIDRLEEVNRELRQTLDDYRAIHSRIQEEVTALSEIREGFGEHLQSFQTEQLNLSTHVTQEQELQQQMREEVDRLITFSETFRTLLNDPNHRQRYEELLELNGRLADTTARIEENTIHIEELREIKEGFRAALNDLLQQIRQADANNTRLEDIASQIEQVINFQLPHPAALHGT